MESSRLNPHHHVFFSQGDPGLGRCGSLDSLHDVTPSERPASHFSDEGKYNIFVSNHLKEENSVLYKTVLLKKYSRI